MDEVSIVDKRFARDKSSVRKIKQRTTQQNKTTLVQFLQ